MAKKANVLLLSLFLLASLAALPFVDAVNQEITFLGTTTGTVTGAFTNSMNYGYQVSLISTLEPTNTIAYAMGVYLMNSTYTGYYIAFNDVYGVASLSVNPVLAGVYYGLDGQPYHSGIITYIDSLFMAQAVVAYNSTTGAFSIKHNGATIVSNTFSGLNLTYYKVENPVGTAGDLVLIAQGPDDSGGNYVNPVYNGIDFKVYTDNVEAGSGGSLAWATTSLPNGLGTPITGSTGYASNIPLGNSVECTATANSGYVFSSYFVSTNKTGSYFPSGYYDSHGRLIASDNFYHIFAAETGTIIDAQTLPFTDIRPGIFSTPYKWSNSTGLFSLFHVTQAHYTVVDNFLQWFTNPDYGVIQSCGVYTANPCNFQYNGGNYTIFASFVSVNFNPNLIGTSPTPNGGGGLGNIDWGTGSFNPTVTNIIEVVIGLFLLFICMAILMKASFAWLVAIILWVVGFMLCMVAAPNLIGLMIVGLSNIIYAVFLFSGNNSGSRRK